MEEKNEKDDIKLSLGTAIFITVVGIFLLIIFMVLVSYVLR